MICPKCGDEQPEGRADCGNCGVIFSKVYRYEPGANDRPGAQTVAGNGAAAWLKENLFYVSPGENLLFVVGRGILFLALLLYGWRLIVTPMQSNYVGETFMHLVNLPFHEAGHIFFSPLGRFMQVLGGTLGQWLVPLVVICAFVAKRNPFGGAVGLWWLGESFMDIAPYMDDARAGQLILLGGVTGSEVEDYHDWEVILRSLGWLRHDHFIARIAFGFGAILMVLSFIWGGYLLWKQFRSAGRQRRTGN